MFCQHCGKEHSTADAVCAHCGPSSVSKENAGAFFGYGGFWMRAGAYLLDGLVLFIPATILSVIVGYVVQNLTTNPIAMIAGMQLFSFAIFWIYDAVLESSSWQATVGKRVMGLKVTDRAGQRISFMRATGRHFGKVISILFMGIGFLTIGFTAKKQGLHDMAAGCLVVRASANPLSLLGKTAMVLSIILFSLIPIGMVAGVAIPAYVDFQARSHVSEAVLLLNTAKEPITEWYAAHESWPVLGQDLQLETSGQFTESLVLSDSGPEAVKPEVRIVATMKNSGVSSRVRGQSVQLITLDGGIHWQCLTGDDYGVEQRMLPAFCRN